MSNITSETTACQNCKSQFTIEPEDFAFYDKINVPPPTFCPACRLQRRLSFFNERTFYKRNCDLCHKSMMTMYAPDSGLTVYCCECYWSDAWNPASYWLDYDPSRPFLSQVHELIRKTPQVGRSVNYPTLVNSDFINHAGTSKNCYLIFTADYCDNVLYSSVLRNNKDSMDCMTMGDSELCYENVMAGKCARVFFSDSCNDCHDVWFSRNLNGCSDCFGCINLRGKQYYIFNEPYTKEAYKEKLKEFAFDSCRGIEELNVRAEKFFLGYPRRFADIIHSTDVTGEYIVYSKNAKNMYQAVGAEDTRYCQFLTMASTKDSYDYTLWGNGVQRLYECLIVGEGADSVKFSNQCWNHVLDVEYSFWTTSSSHMFGCANIRKKEYCILNKQYTKESFKELKARIIQDMNKNPYKDAGGREYRYGEFFPIEMSLHAYNETQAMDYFPLSEEEVHRQGYAWRTLPVSSAAPTLLPNQIPDRIGDVPDSIINEILECASCKRPYRIIPAELDLLGRFGIPIPRKCFYCRHEDRLKNRLNPPRLWSRSCARCSAPIETSYASERPEIVYCEQCYQNEVV